MTRKRAALIVFLVVVAGLYAGYRHMAKQDMIECTLEWGRLAPFPVAAEQFSIKTEGGPFTRAFRVSFKASPDVIRRWVEASPGLRSIGPRQLESGIRKFIVAPGGGAQYAEVQIDDLANLVKVYVYWS